MQSKSILEQEFDEGMEKGIAKSLIAYLEHQFQAIPDSLIGRINSIHDSVVLSSWFQMALRSASLEEFQKSIQ